MQEIAFEKVATVLAEDLLKEAIFIKLREGMQRAFRRTKRAPKKQTYFEKHFRKKEEPKEGVVGKLKKFTRKHLMTDQDIKNIGYGMAIPAPGASGATYVAGKLYGAGKFLTQGRTVTEPSVTRHLAKLKKQEERATRHKANMEHRRKLRQKTRARKQETRRLSPEKRKRIEEKLRQQR